MPLICPQRLTAKLPMSRFRDIKDDKDFVFQKLRGVFGSVFSCPTFRIVLSANRKIVVARGDDLDEEWKFLTSEVSTIIPKSLRDDTSPHGESTSPILQSIPFTSPSVSSQSQQQVSTSSPTHFNFSPVPSSSENLSNSSYATYKHDGTSDAGGSSITTLVSAHGTILAPSPRSEVSNLDAITNQIDRVRRVSQTPPIAAEVLAAASYSGISASRRAELRVAWIVGFLTQYVLENPEVPLVARSAIAIDSDSETALQIEDLPIQSEDDDDDDDGDVDIGCGENEDCSGVIDDIVEFSVNGNVGRYSPTPGKYKGLNISVTNPNGIVSHVDSEPQKVFYSKRSPRGRLPNRVVIATSPSARSRNNLLDPTTVSGESASRSKAMSREQARTLLHLRRPKATQMLLAKPMYFIVVFVLLIVYDFQNLLARQRLSRKSSGSDELSMNVSFAGIVRGLIENIIDSNLAGSLLRIAIMLGLIESIVRKSTTKNTSTHTAIYLNRALDYLFPSARSNDYLVVPQNANHSARNNQILASLPNIAPASLSRIHANEQKDDLAGRSDAVIDKILDNGRRALRIAILPSTSALVNQTKAREPCPTQKEPTKLPMPQQMSRVALIQPGSCLKAPAPDPTLPEDVLAAYEPPYGTWSDVQRAEWTNVRCGPNYARNKQKAPSLPFIYDVRLVDIFRSEKKLLHVGRFFNLDAVSDISLQNTFGNLRNNLRTSSNFSGPMPSEGPASFVPAGSPLQSRATYDGCASFRETVNKEKENFKNVPISGIPVVANPTLSSAIRSIPGGIDTGSIPRYLILNFTMPLYAPSMWSKTHDGPSVSMVYCCELSSTALSQVQEHRSGQKKHGFVTLLERFIEGRGADGTRENVNYRMRVKCISRVCNLHDLEMNAVAASLVRSNNGTPFMIRDTSTFYFGPNYLEIDIDVHRFSYFARTALNGLKETIAKLIFDFGIVIQADDDEEMPEQMLMSARISAMDLEGCPEIPSEELLLKAASGDYTDLLPQSMTVRDYSSSQDDSQNQKSAISGHFDQLSNVKRK